MVLAKVVPVHRREFIIGLGTAALLGASQAQQSPTPVVGYLSPGATVPRPFLDGLAEVGFIVGRNVKIETRLIAHAHQLPEVAADFARK